MRRLAASLLVCTLATPIPAAAAPPFTGKIRTLSPGLRTWMTGRSWHEGCPVALDDLRLVTVRRYDFAGRVRLGSLVVHRDVAPDVVRVFRRLYRKRFPIRRMVLVDRYRGDDFASIEADNTSAFNCRRATGSSSWSNHAYGRAIDINPIENPYVSGGSTSHRASEPYLDRSPYRKGMAVSAGVLVRAFDDAAGWGWGGTWTGSVRDYQHFSANGR